MSSTAAMTTQALVGEAELAAPGWRASWLNGWLAALGAAVLDDITVRFVDDGAPIPVLSSGPGRGDVLDQLVDAFPSSEDLGHSVLARFVDEHELPRNPTMEQWSWRAQRARETGDRMLGATITDLTENAMDRLEHSPFDATVPKGLTLFDRVISCRGRVGDDVRFAIEQSMAGLAQRAGTNGLGFDATRIPVPAATNTNKHADVVAECLAFQALTLFPVRGDGRQAGVTRLWTGSAGRTGSFAWPVWDQPLDCAAIDCLLDEFSSVWAGSSAAKRAKDGFWRQMDRLGIFEVYESVPYRPLSTMDSTRGFASRLSWSR